MKLYSGKNNVARRAMVMALVTALAVSSAACGKKEASVPEETLIASAEQTTAAVTEAPTETEKAEETTKETETSAEETTEASTEIPEKDFEFKIEKVMDYDLPEGEVYRHAEMSWALAGDGYGAVNNADGFLYMPLEPGERSNVQFSLEDSDELTSTGEKSYLYQAMEFQCFSYPEVGIRAICLPVRLHADQEPACMKREVRKIYDFDPETFKKSFQCEALLDTVKASVFDMSTAKELYGEDWTDAIWIGGVKPEGEMLAENGIGIFGFENDRYSLEVSSKKTDLVPDGGTIYQMTTREILNELWAWGTSQMLADSGNVRILEKDGYKYVYIYSDSMAVDGSIVAQAWLFRVKDGISQGVSFMMHSTDDTNYFKLFDYILNCSLEFYDMDTIKYDEGNMETYKEALEAYKNGTGDDPGRGGYWLCEKFFGN